METVTITALHGAPDGTLAVDYRTGTTYRAVTIMGDARVVVTDAAGISVARAPHTLVAQLGDKALPVVWRPVPALYCSPEDNLHGVPVQ